MVSVEWIISNWEAIVMIPSLMLSWLAGIRRRRISYMIANVVIVAGMAGYAIGSPGLATHNMIGMALIVWGLLGTFTSLWLTNRMNTAFPYAAVVSIAGVALLLV